MVSGCHQDAVEDFPALTIYDMILLAGGKARFKAARSYTVKLPDGQNVSINLLRRPANLKGTIVELQCPTCGRAARILRVVPWGAGLACGRDFRSRSIQYQATIRRKATLVETGNHEIKY